MKSTFYKPYLDDLILRFRVKSATDAVILLAGCEHCDGHEIVIGGWDNTKSVIRMKKQSPADGNVRAETKSILDGNEFREFWIQTASTTGKTRVIYVGKGGEEWPILKHEFTMVHNISHIAFASWAQNKIEYEILNGKVISNILYIILSF